MDFFSYVEIMRDILRGLQNRNIFIWLETPDLKFWIYILSLYVSHLHDSNLSPFPNIFLTSWAPDLHLLMNSPDLVITEGKMILKRKLIIVMSACPSWASGVSDKVDISRKNIYIGSVLEIDGRRWPSI